MKKLNPISFTLPSAQYRATGLPLCLMWVFIMNQQNEKQYKMCLKCEEAKPISEFYKDKKAKDGLHSYCKSCVKEYSKKWQKVNPERAKKANKKWREVNSEYNKENSKKWKKANPEKIKENNKRWKKANPEYNKRWKKANPEKTKESVRNWRKANPEYNKKWHKANSEKVKERIKKWREENKEYKKEYDKNRKAIDPLFKLQCNIRSLIGKSLKKQDYTKNSKTYEILGIGYEEFYNWLNDKVSNGLNTNTDDFHLDHVIPVSLGQTEEEILKLSHYSNFQLLRSKENNSKYNSFIYQNNLNRVLKYHSNPEMLKKIVNRSNIKII